MADGLGGDQESVQPRDDRANEMALHALGTRILEHCCEDCQYIQPRPANSVLQHGVSRSTLRKPTPFVQERFEPAALVLVALPDDES